ncbi:lectin subunit alpha-like [Musca vetustissima]|uniref:lectin subunit alpha-like n=1 Tax=Musca vetustissima TaxID=27455 RepID=UPI002AB68577|nr:lectin subunit alpha-like [Musca vetustissima]
MDAQLRPTWYTANNGKRYLIELDTKLNWLQANSECKRRGLQILEIDSYDKNAQIKNILQKIWGGSKNIWLGYHDGFSTSMDNNRPFYSISTGLQINYKDWYTSGISSQQAQGHCGQISSDHNLQWIAADCSTKNAFICETSTSIQNSSDNNKRQTIFEANQKISAEFTNLQSKMRQANENILQTTLSALERQQKSTNDLIADVKKSIENILNKNSFLSSIMADYIKMFTTLVTEKEAELSRISEETQRTILSSQSQGENSLNELTSKFANALTSNTNEINRLLGS